MSKPMNVPILSRTDFRLDAARRLRDIIARLGLTQTQAAALMGVSKHVLQNWLNGDNAIGAYALYRLSRAKGVDFNYIFLNDWSNLPCHLVEGFELELKGKLAAAPAGGHRVREKKREKSGVKS